MGLPGQIGPAGKRGSIGGMGLPGKQGDQGVKGQLVRADTFFLTTQIPLKDSILLLCNNIHTLPSFFFIRGILANKDFRGCLVSSDQR